jgi:hypothetical protein
MNRLSTTIFSAGCPVAADSWVRSVNGALLVEMTWQTSSSNQTTAPCGSM